MPTIALVDDDKNILTSLRMVFEAEGYKIQTYNDGTTALNGISYDPPDIVILDIKMPRMDGMELLPPSAKIGNAGHLFDVEGRRSG